MEMSETWPDTFSDGYIHQFQTKPPTKFTGSSKRTEFKDILPWITCKMITTNVPISPRIVMNYAMKRDICCEDDGMWMETETTLSEFLNGGKAFVEEILASQKRNKSKRAWHWESVWNPSRKGNYLSKVVWNRNIITEFTRSISSTSIGKSVLMIDVKVSKDKHISRWVDWENLIYVRWNRIKNCAQRWRKWSIEEKEVRHWVK